MDGLMNRTLSSNSVIESVKTRRAIIDHLQGYREHDTLFL